MTSLQNWKICIRKETSKLADVIFTTMIENQRLAKELDRPSCQDTGVIQFLVEGELPADRRAGSAAA
jgi:tartrate dehydratase alpha subunit/fumarate hydratase class I-like protein